MAGLEPLSPGDVVEYSLNELRTMDIKNLAKVAFGLGIDVSELTNRNQVLTRLMESATDISLLH